MGERTVVEAVSSKFADTAALTNGDETTTGLPGCEDVKDDVPLRATFVEMGAEETLMEERAAAKLLSVCLAVIMVRLTATEKRELLYQTALQTNTLPPM